MCRLVFPIYGISVRPQGNGATTTDIILQSKTMLPKVVLGRTEAASLEKKRITLTEAKNRKHIIKSFDRLSFEERRRETELKVLLDEESNIIVDDEETKREEHRSKIWQRRTTLVTKPDHFDDNLSESTSSEEAMEIQERITHKEKAEALKNVYVELVIKSRKLYLDYHESHPGFFTSVLLMDDYTRAFDSLIDLIHETYTNLPYRKSIFLSEMQHFRHEAIPIALENIVNEITENLSISKLQRKKILKLRGINCPSQNKDRD
ncbi:PREDICTED: uncharacterized protein LOC105570029 isoform X2 [Vollenhovia emeryi]|uniref:uncharacterized protein LOC105570029 isoform X2 n=1 Tax=Vollenhovia emeryi TaxID=411798 RepID=UPI0005F56A3D|nr:PREDICTED: uncharacterized protein LOC105570029 isoform X2 [Vollenhovia emeryi]